MADRQTKRRPSGGGTGADDLRQEIEIIIHEASLEPYGLAALDGEIAELRQAVTGERNQRLNRAAYSLGQLVAGDVLDEHTATEELLSAALDIGLHPREARSAIRSGLNAGKRRPRAPEKAHPHTRPVEAPRPNFRVRDEMVRLLHDPAWPFEWEVAKQLAAIPPALARQDILDNWDYLSARVDIPRLVATTNMLRGIATFRYLNARTVETPEPYTEEPPAGAEIVYQDGTNRPMWHDGQEWQPKRDKDERPPIDVAVRRLQWEVQE